MPIPFCLIFQGSTEPSLTGGLALGVGCGWGLWPLGASPVDTTPWSGAG